MLKYKYSRPTMLEGKKGQEVINYLCNEKRPMILPNVPWATKRNKRTVNLKQTSATEQDINSQLM